MLCKCHWIVLYTVYFTAFCLGGAVFFWSRCMSLCMEGINYQIKSNHLFESGDMAHTQALHTRTQYTVIQKKENKKKLK